MEILNRMNPSEAGSITTKYITYNKTFHVMTAVSPFFFPGSNTPPPFFPQVNYNIGMTAFSKTTFRTCKLSGHWNENRK